LLLVLESDAY